MGHAKKIMRECDSQPGKPLAPESKGSGKQAMGIRLNKTGCLMWTRLNRKGNRLKDPDKMACWRSLAVVTMLSTALSISWAGKFGQLHHRGAEGDDLKRDHGGGLRVRVARA